MGNMLNVFRNLQNTIVNLEPSLNMDVNVAIIPLIKGSCEINKMCILCLESCKTSLRVLCHAINIQNCNVTGNHTDRNC